MATDPFDDLLEIENEYYREGYDAGVSDSTYAGIIEGKVFGIEKGYEKALELGKLHGRGLVWRARLSNATSMSDADVVEGPREPSSTVSSPQMNIQAILSTLPPLAGNARLQKNVDSLLTVTDGKTVVKDNSDESVTEFDDRVTKAKAKAKVIANVVGEPVNPASSTTNSGIEDATGLNARH